MRSLFAVALAALVSAPLAAQSNEVAVFGGSTHVSTTDTDGSSIKFDSGTAFGAGYNHFWTQRISSEFSFLRSSHEGSIRFGGDPLLNVGKLDLMTIAAVAQFHIVRSRSLDVYAGGGAAYVQADDLSSADLRTAGISSVKVDTKTTWVANAGASIALNRTFAVGIDGKYVHYRPSSASAGSDAVTLDLDPLTIALALKFRF